MLAKCEQLTNLERTFASLWMAIRLVGIEINSRRRGSSVILNYCKHYLEGS